MEIKLVIVAWDNCKHSLQVVSAYSVAVVSGSTEFVLVVIK